MFTAGAGELTFLYHSLTVSPAAYRYDVETRNLERLTAPAIEHPDLTARLAWATSADGTRIPVEIVHRTDLDRSRAHPAFVHAYGGFSYALLPGYFPQFAVFAESGGVFAIPHCRGGTEYGREWWHGGRLLTKRHTFEDLFAGAELLVAEGLTEPGRIAFEGASNGGVLALAASNQRPDLWACAVSMVPLSDLMRVDRDGKEPWTGKVSFVEYGRPDDPDEGPYLLSWSPYHDVRESSPYPAVLVCSGESDIRCPVWHARKWVARARHATSTSNPIRLRIYPAMGHGTGLTVRRQGEWLAEWMGFVFDCLGLEPSV
jgi:prolyl oligopeptidase